MKNQKRKEKKRKEQSGPLDSAAKVRGVNEKMRLAHDDSNMPLAQVLLFYFILLFTSGVRELSFGNVAGGIDAMDDRHMCSLIYMCLCMSISTLCLFPGVEAVAGVA